MDLYQSQEMCGIAYLNVYLFCNGNESQFSILLKNSSWSCDSQLGLQKCVALTVVNMSHRSRVLTKQKNNNKNINI